MGRQSSSTNGRVLRGFRRAGLAVPLALIALAVSAGASGTPVSVAVGAAPVALAAATPIGGLAPKSRLKLTLVLRSRDPVGLAALAAAVSDPASPSFHHYLSVHQFAARFGASPAGVDTLRRTLEGEGLHAGGLAPDGLSLAVSGSASVTSRAFDVSLQRYRVRSGLQLYANTAPPRVPAALGGVVADVLGLSNVPAAVPEGLVAPALKAPAHAARRPLAHAADSSGGPTPCPQATAVETANPRFFTIDQIATAYGMDDLYANGDFGQGVSIAMFELDPYASTSVEQTDLAAFQACYGTDAQVTVEPLVDGGATTPATPTAESAVDIENAIGIAPQAHIEVFEGPNTGQGGYDTLAAILAKDQAQVINDSWGLCELEDPTFSQIEANLLTEAAIQGQSFIASSGDRGAEGCASEWNDNLTNIPEQSGDANAPKLSVDDPASQQYATGVGATNLLAIGPPPVETAWDHLYWGASGGGISTLWSMPAYQADAGVPGVFNSYSSASPCAASPNDTGGYCREVPDVSLNGSTETGYVTFYEGAWTAFGGTSTAAPVWAALVALADASGLPGCASPASESSRLGFLNPLLYEIAAGDEHADAFNDVTVGDNSGYFAGTNPYGAYPGGAYPATPGYDMVSGLGTPIATDGSSPGLVSQLCTANATPIGAAPTLTGLAVSEAAPGSSVTISGSGFTRYTAVFFGNVAATSVEDLGPTQLVATVPPGSGSVNVTLTDLAGPSTTSAADTFTYSPTEQIASPASGAAYNQGQPVVASYTCSAFGAGPTSCSGPAASGTAIDTSALGVHEFPVTATDANGVSTTTTVSYTVLPVTSSAIAGGPAIAIREPASGALYSEGHVVKARFSCTATAPATIVSCAAPVAAAAAINTSTPGRHSFTVSATDSRGRSSTLTAGYTVVAAHPTISGLQQSATKWLERTDATTRLPLGTTFSFSLDQAATLKLTFTQLASGRVAGGRCVPPARARPHARSCTRGLSAGTLIDKAPAGADTLTFSGLTSRGRLSPATYTVVLRATGLSGKPSAPSLLLFTIASPKR
jgi:hypothetical protein